MEDLRVSRGMGDTDPTATHRAQLRLAYHLIPAADWDAAPDGQPFRARSLATEGFIHLTHRMADLVEVANHFYLTNPGPHVVLTIDLRVLTVPWRYDGDERYPHVYGPLDRAAISEVRPIVRDESGSFLPIAGPHPRRPGTAKSPLPGRPEVSASGPESR